MRRRDAVALSLVVSLGSVALVAGLGAQEATRTETSQVIRGKINLQSRPIQPVAAPRPAQAQRCATQGSMQETTTANTDCSVGGSATINSPPDGSPPLGCTPDASGECSINFDIDYDVSCSTTEPPPVSCNFCLFWKIKEKFGGGWTFVADSRTAFNRDCNSNNHIDHKLSRPLHPGTPEQPKTYRITAGIKESCDDVVAISSATSIFSLYEEQ